MRIEYLKEFVCFADFLSIVRAAKALHTTQSTLGKHIIEIEREVGVPLITRNHKKTYLTPAGTAFVERAREIADSYDALVALCKEINSQRIITARATSSTFNDHTTELFYSFCQDLQIEQPSIQIKFVRPTRQSLDEDLANGYLDIVLAYFHGSAEAIATEYHERGFFCKHLSSEELALFCQVDDPLNHDGLTLSELKGRAVMMPNDNCYQLKTCFDVLCKKNGFSPTYKLVSTDNQAEFLLHNVPGRLYIYPKSMGETPLFRSMRNMVFREFTDNTTVNTFILACNREDELSDLISPYFD